MKNYSIKAGITLPLKKYIPGYGLCTITADTTDAQAEAIIATGHGSMFEPIDRDAMLASNEAEEQSTEATVVPESPVTNSPVTKKRNGKATTK